jgi:hypothetical protein
MHLGLRYISDVSQRRLLKTVLQIPLADTLIRDFLDTMAIVSETGKNLR